MKTNIISLSVLAATLSTATLVLAQERIDPTHPTGNMEDTLRSQIVEFRSLTLGALVVGADDKGIALFSSAGVGAGLSSFQVRSGSSVVQELGGIPVRLNVKSVTADGVEIEAPTLSEKLVIPSGLKSLPPTKTEVFFEIGRHQPRFTPDFTPPFTPASSPVTLLVRLAMVKASSPVSWVFDTVRSDQSSCETII